MRIRPLVAPVGGWWQITETLSGPDDWDGWTVKAQIRAYPEAPEAVATLDAVATAPREVTVTMRRAHTETLGEFAGVWALKLTAPGGEPQTPVGGPVLITSRATI